MEIQFVLIMLKAAIIQVVALEVDVVVDSAAVVTAEVTETSEETEIDLVVIALEGNNGLSIRFKEFFLMFFNYLDVTMIVEAVVVIEEASEVDVMVKVVEAVAFVVAVAAAVVVAVAAFNAVKKDTLPENAHQVSFLFN